MGESNGIGMGGIGGGGIGAGGIGEGELGPPRPRFALSLGVTGHRAHRLGNGSLPVIERRVRDIVADIAEAAAGAARDGAAWHDGAPPLLRIVSALSEGADRLVAEAALARGFGLAAILPFTVADYRDDFADAESNAEFDALLGRATGVLTLPGDPDERVAAYALAADAIVAASDMLIAVWDGAPALGRGGTGDVVAAALAAGRPVVQVPLDPHAAPCLYWSGFEALPIDSRDIAHSPSEPWEAARLGPLFEALLLPPSAPEEQRQLRQFFGEHQRTRHWRIEYPLLLALTGASPLKPGAWRRDPYRQATRAEWAGFGRAGGRHCGGNIGMLGTLEGAYAWTDQLAQHFAQSFRSGHVVNFTFAAIASIVALLGLLWPAAKFWLVATELLIIGVVMVNTRVGSKQEWQRRWLDYRSLAERLRPMRSLKLLGVARPPDPPSRKRGGNRRWTDWYAKAQWRAMGPPCGVLDASETLVQRLIAEHELGPEIAYHRSNARKMAHVEHRLHKLGGAAFVATVLLCIGFLAVYLLDPDFMSRQAKLFTVLTAALPAFGGATYALRLHGDYAGTAGRSTETADELATIAAELAGGPLPLARAAALAEAAARIMLVDLGEWRLTYEQRALALPG